MYDLVISGGTIVTADAKHRVIDDGVVAVAGDTIAAILTKEQAAQHNLTAREHMNADNMIVMPALINSHCHLAERLFSGSGAGVTRHKKEGDGATPVGIMRGHALFYRSDRIPPPPCPITPRPIRRSMHYCDDPASPLYNQMIFSCHPPSCSHERLWRNDGIYDIILILTHNRHPTIARHGSAIFIHLADNETSHTQGCIAIHYDEMCDLLSHVTKRSRFIIHEM